MLVWAVAGCGRLWPAVADRVHISSSSPGAFSLAVIPLSTHGDFSPGLWVAYRVVETLVLVTSLHLWLQFLTVLRLDPGSFEVGQLP